MFGLFGGENWCKIMDSNSGTEFKVWEVKLASVGPSYPVSQVRH
jgi:hypothetical protein